jgi:hypothetical protein
LWVDSGAGRFLSEIYVSLTDLFEGFKLIKLVVAAGGHLRRILATIRLLAGARATRWRLIPVFRFEPME